MAAPGQTVEVAAGSYSDTTLPVDATKTATQDVVFVPATGATPSFSATLHIAARHLELRGMRFQGTLWIDATAQDVTLRSNTYKNFQVFSSGTQAPRDISFIGGSAGPSVDDNNRIASNGTSTTASPTNILIDGMEIHDFTLSAGSDAHVECLQVWAVDGLTIRNSRFRNCEVFDVFLQKLPGGAAATPTNILIENNFMQCCGSGYFAIRLADHAGTHWQNVTIRNNSFDKEINPDGGVPYTNVKIVNNIGPKLSFFTGATGGESSKPAGITANYNVWYAGSKVGAQDKVASHGYVNAAAGDLHLKPGAAAIDSGDPSSYPAKDIDGNSRPGGGGAGCRRGRGDVRHPDPDPDPDPDGDADADGNPDADGNADAATPRRQRRRRRQRRPRPRRQRRRRRPDGDPVRRRQRRRRRRRRRRRQLRPRPTTPSPSPTDNSGPRRRRPWPRQRRSRPSRRVPAPLGTRSCRRPRLRRRG